MRRSTGINSQRRSDGGPSSGHSKQVFTVTQAYPSIFSLVVFSEPDLPEEALLADDMAFIDYLWSYWTSEGYRDDEHIRLVKQHLKQPSVLSTTLAYYRAMFDLDLADPALTTLRSTLSNHIGVPTLAMCGADDLRAELMREQENYFVGEYQYVEVPKAGHFLHREQSDQVNQILIEWLKRKF